MPTHSNPIAFHGRSYPMTTVTPIAPRFRLRARYEIWKFRVLVYIARTPWLLRIYRVFFKEPPLKRLRDHQFIHFARWILVDARHFREGLRDSYLIFSTNFNGDWHQYLDAFAFTLNDGLDYLWGTSSGYPGAQPVTPFKEYARRHMLPASYYYNAYPGASVRDIEAALDVHAELATFKEKSKNPTSPQDFRIEFTKFVASIQDKLGTAHTRLPPRMPLAPLEHAFRWEP